MAEADFITGLIKKGLGAAVGAAAGKLGSTAASFVLDLLGFERLQKVIDGIPDEALRHPRLRLDVAAWMVGGVFADFGSGAHLKPSGMLHPYLTWALTRAGERPSYRLELPPVHLAGLTTPLAFAREDRHSVEVKELPSGSWVNIPVDEDVREIKLAPASEATGVLALEVRPAVSAGTYRFATADGSGLALFDRGEYGKHRPPVGRRPHLRRLDAVTGVHP